MHKYAPKINYKTYYENGEIIKLPLHQSGTFFAELVPQHDTFDVYRTSKLILLSLKHKHNNVHFRLYFEHVFRWSSLNIPSKLKLRKYNSVKFRDQTL